MQLKSLKNQLIATTGVSGLVAAGIFGWAFWNSPADIAEISGGSSQPNALGASATIASNSQRNFEDLWNLDLRGPRMSQVPTIEPASTNTMATIPEPRFAIQLLGTIIEGSQAVGIFADASGGFDVKSAGEDLELSPVGVRISRIERGVAIVNYSGKEVRLEVPNTSPMAGVPVSTEAQNAMTNGETYSTNSPSMAQPVIIPAPMNYGATQPAPIPPILDTGDLSDPLPPGLDPANDVSGYQRALAPKVEKGPMQ